MLSRWLDLRLGRNLMQLLSLLLGDMRLLNKLAHALARLRHLQNLILLLGYVRIKLAGDCRIEHSLLVG